MINKAIEIAQTTGTRIEIRFHGNDEIESSYFDSEQEIARLQAFAQLPESDSLSAMVIEPVPADTAPAASPTDTMYLWQITGVQQQQQQQQPQTSVVIIEVGCRSYPSLPLQPDVLY